MRKVAFIIFVITCVFSQVFAADPADLMKEYESVLNKPSMEKGNRTNKHDANIAEDEEADSSDETSDEDLIQLDDELKDYVIFGHEIFNQELDGVADKNVSVPDSYVLSAGDELVLNIWGRITDSEEVFVDNNGDIFSSTFGKINIAGLTYSGLKRKISTMAKDMEGVDAQIVVSGAKTVKVLVAGSVNKPGYYVMSVYATATQSIADAGGVQDTANIRNVKIIRNGKVLKNIDYYDLLLYGIDKTSGIGFQPNDVVYVPRTEKRVLVAGAVKSEAYFELKNEKSLKDVLKLSGGFAANALKSNVTVRKVGDDYSNYVLKRLDTGNSEDMKVRIVDGDSIFVPEIKQDEKNVVFLLGNVYYPGKYEFKEGDRISDIIKSYDSIKSDSYIESAYILRKGDMRSDSEIIPFSIKDVIESKGSSGDLILQAYDEIIVINKVELTKDIYINVNGEVKTPDSYQVERDMSVYDLIVKAGGLTGESDQNRIEVVNIVDGKLNMEIINVKGASKTRAPANGYVTVHNIFSSDIIRYVEISGDVVNSGEYLYSDGMTIFSLLSNVGYKLTKEDQSTMLIYRKSEKSNRYLMLEYDFDEMLKNNADIGLYPDDKIKIAKNNKFDESAVVAISGAVNSPGNFPFGEGLTIGSLIKLAGGLAQNAMTESIEIISKNIENGKVTMSYDEVDLDEAYLHKVKPYDKVMVKEILDVNFSSYVTLRGEVKYPGIYPIRKGERLSSVIKRAGGFADNADLYSAKLLRQSVKFEKKRILDSLVQKIEQQMLSNVNNVAATSISNTGVQSAQAMMTSQKQFIDNLKKIEPEGRLVVAFSHPRLMTGSVNDVLLENDDVIEVPVKKDTINVVGAVLNAGTFVFSDRIEWEDYVKLAGGYNRGADDDNVYIIKANGTSQRVTEAFMDWSEEERRWEFTSFTQRNNLRAGDTIIVPEKYTKVPWLRNIKDITQVMMQIAVTGGVVANF